METKIAERQIIRAPNRLGIKGWAWAGRYKYERYLYTLHRLTGLGLLFYLGMHLFVNGSRLGGEKDWTDMMDTFSGGGFKVGEYLVVAAFVIHALNGGRLMVQQLGFALGRPKTPVYPYVDALRRKRTLTWVMSAIMLALLVFALVVFIA